MGLGWIVGEEVIFHQGSSKLVRHEMCRAITEACVLQLGIPDFKQMSSSSAKIGGGASFEKDYSLLYKYL